MLVDLDMGCVMVFFIYTDHVLVDFDIGFGVCFMIFPLSVTLAMCWSGGVFHYTDHVLVDFDLGCVIVIYTDLDFDVHGVCHVLFTLTMRWSTLTWGLVCPCFMIFPFVSLTGHVLRQLRAGRF